MGLARDLVVIERQLRQDGAVDLFVPLDQGGLTSAPEVMQLLGHQTSPIPSDPARVVQLCLQALQVQYDELSPRLLDAELVATLPPGMPGLARPTRRVIREMLTRAADEVILLGYEFTDHETVKALSGAAKRGADVIVICDRERGTATNLLNLWDKDAPAPHVFEDSLRPEAAPYASMHAKSLLVDGSELLVTSANFTFHGLQGNIEIGIRLAGAKAAEARKVFSYLLEAGIVSPHNIAS